MLQQSHLAQATMLQQSHLKTVTNSRNLWRSSCCSFDNL
jgi:hypothetical protein